MSVDSTNNGEDPESPNTATNKTPEGTAIEEITTGENGESASIEVAGPTTVNKEAQHNTDQDEPSKPPTKKLCGVCNQNESKYKCTRCYLPYCSVACSKQHKINHPPDEPKPAIETVPTPAPATGIRKPGTLGAGAFQGPFAALDSAAEIKLLFKLYPNLPKVLESINTATLPPVDEYTPSGLPTSIRKGKEQPWNSDRGLQRGVEALKQARNSDGKDGEAVREYGRVILQVLAKEEGLTMTTEEIIQKELAEENARIVEQLLNGDIG